MHLIHLFYVRGRFIDVHDFTLGSLQGPELNGRTGSAAGTSRDYKTPPEKHVITYPSARLRKTLVQPLKKGRSNGPTQFYIQNLAENFGL